MGLGCDIGGGGGAIIIGFIGGSCRLLHLFWTKTMHYVGIAALFLGFMAGSVVGFPSTMGACDNRPPSLPYFQKAFEIGRKLLVSSLGSKTFFPGATT